MASALETSQPTPQPYIGVMGIQGRNGSDSSFLLPDTQCLEAMNVDWFGASLGRKRGGASSLSLSSSGTAFASGVMALHRHVPSRDQAAAEFWAIDGARVFHRLTGGVTWADVTSIDPCTATPQETVFLSFNNKLYIAYKSAHNRLHVWDGTTIRRVGIDKPAAPTTAVAAGAVTDTRKYRICFTKKVGVVTTYRSELSVPTAAIAMVTQQTTITRSTAPGEGETHWEVYAASTSSGYGDYRLVGVATIVATTTIVDNAALSADTAPDDGTNTPAPSCRYMVADDARIIMAGAYEDASNPENAMVPSDHRVWWTSVLGAGTGDDERVSNTGTTNNYADLEEAITGISQPMQVVTSAATSLERGSFYVFSFLSQWKFISTGDSDAPYLKFRITGGGGCIHHKSILTAIDSNGNPAVYWWSPNGPMRIAVDGQQYLGEDIADIVETVNLDATIPCHSVYYPALRQVWFYIATGSSLYPNKKVIYDTRLGRMIDTSTGVRYGWALHEGASTLAYCSTLFSDSVGASMGRLLKPYVGYTTSTKIFKCDTADFDDDGVPYQAYIDTKSYAPWGLGRKGGIMDFPMLVAGSAGGVSIRLTTYRDEGGDSDTADANLTDLSDSGEATRVFPRFEDARLQDSFSIRCRIGDAQASANSWFLDALVIPINYMGDH